MKKLIIVLMVCVIFFCSIDRLVFGVELDVPFLPQVSPGVVGDWDHTKNVDQQVLLW